MAEQEIDVIGHLIDVERNAASLLADAQAEADKRISSARAKADEMYRAQYTAIVDSEEAAYAQKSDELKRQCEKTITDYKTRIGAVAKDTAAFTALLDKLLA